MEDVECTTDSTYYEPVSKLTPDRICLLPAVKGN